jgi:putative transposase
MGRKPREKSQGNIFHVYQRGNNKEYLFNSDESKGMLIHLFKDFRKKFDYEILGYVIMDNHYHFIIKVNNDPLKDIMKFINIVYAKYLNKALDRSGHVYESRYKCKKVNTNEYLLWLIRYLHRNPIRANMVKNLEDYFWSSHYFYKTANNEFINTNFLLNLISNKKARAILGYMKYVSHEGNDDNDDEDFKILSSFFKSENKGDESYLETNYLCQGRDNLDIIGNRFFTDDKIKEIILCGGRQRYLTPIRVNFINEAISHRYTMKEIANYLNCAESTVSSLWSRNKHKQYINT